VAFQQQLCPDSRARRAQARNIVSPAVDMALFFRRFGALAKGGLGMNGGQVGMTRRVSAVGVVIAGLYLGALPALSETQISVYGGANWNLGSTVTLDAPGPVNDQRSVDWEGGSFGMPPYWGVRGVYWLGRASNWGFAIDYTHQKAIAEIDFANDGTYDRLEFTDGNNLVIFEVLYRFSPTMNGALVPYLGVGAGVTIPHVEVTLDNGSKTFQYQLAGPAAQVLAGLEYKLSESWSLFTEAKLSYSHISADLNGGGRLETDLWSPQLAIGLTYRFPGN
jgi:lipid A oxidase